MENKIENVPDSPEIPQDSNRKRKILISLGVFIIVAIVTFIFLTKSSEKSAEVIKATLPIPTQLIPTPTPYPFKELTIPYLRERTYKSSIISKTISYDNPSYTASIATYDSDGLKINGLLTIPSGPVPRSAKGEVGWPAIIFIHGYIPPAQYSTTSQYYDYVDYLARNGFVVFKIDLRGHGNSEGEPGGAYYSVDYTIDTLNAYAALQNTDFVNPKKIGLWGHSMAGNVVFRSLAVKPDIPAVVIWAGAVYSYTDRKKYGINDASYQPSQNISERQRLRQRLFDTHGDTDLDNIFWKEFIPTNYLSDIKGAIQINHAVNDDVVNIGYSRDLMKLLDETRVTHELHEYSSGGHNISGGSFVEAMKNTVEFYKTYLEK